MEKSTNKNNKNFLKEGFTDVSKHHKEYLGTDLPEDYFVKSKLSILKKIKEESTDNTFLKEKISDVTQHHKEYLGTDIPEDYFTKSKLSILDKIKEETIIDETPIANKKQKVFWLQPQFRYIAAASVVFILSLTIWLQNTNNNGVEESGVELLSFNDDVLISSLLVDDSEMDVFADNTLINEIVIKAELSEQKMDNLILDTMIVEDSLLDNYMDDKFIETIIL